jgi:hypothetical protein
MGEKVTHSGGVGTVEQVCWWLDFFRALRHPPSQQRLIVVQKGGGASPKRPRFTVQLVVGIADHFGSISVNAYTTLVNVWLQTDVFFAASSQRSTAEDQTILRCR